MSYLRRGWGIDGHAEHNHMPAVQSGSTDALLFDRTFENVYRAEGGITVGDLLNILNRAAEENNIDILWHVPGETLYEALSAEFEQEVERLRQLVYLAHNDDCGCDICMAARGSEPEEDYEPDPTICCICGEPIEGDDMQDRYWLHELGCDFYESGICDCDLECHADCYKGHESEYLGYDEEG